MSKLTNYFVIFFLSSACIFSLALNAMDNGGTPFNKSNPTEVSISSCLVLTTRMIVKSFPKIIGELRKNSTITSIDAHDTNINGDQLRLILSICDKTITSLNLSGCKKITDDLVLWIVEHCNNLKSLYLSKCPELYKLMIVNGSCDNPICDNHKGSLAEIHLGGCEGLRILTVISNKLTTLCASECPNLEGFFLRCPILENLFFDSCRSLKEVFFSKCSTALTSKYKDKNLYPGIDFEIS